MTKHGIRQDMNQNVTHMAMKQTDILEICAVVLCASMLAEGHSLQHSWQGGELVTKNYTFS